MTTWQLLFPVRCHILDRGPMISYLLLFVALSKKYHQCSVNAFSFFLLEVLGKFHLVSLLCQHQGGMEFQSKTLFQISVWHNKKKKLQFSLKSYFFIKKKEVLHCWTLFNVAIIVKSKISLSKFDQVLLYVAVFIRNQRNIL